MLEKPDLQDDKIIACLQEAYGLPAVRVEFLPLGVDVNAAVYRAFDEHGTPYFVKLRRGVIDDITVALPKFLSDRGIAQIIAPVTAKTGQLWAGLDTYTLIVYPFVEGRDGYHAELTACQWSDLGVALRMVHTTELPPALRQRIPRETYSAQWREMVRQFLSQGVDETYDDAALQMASFLEEKRAEILDLVGRAEALAQALQSESPEFVVCHSDIHAGNVLISASGSFYIVDWDNPILAPKERDLMFIGGAQGFIGHTAQEEEALFYQGYGRTQVDPRALTYYRYERIVEDIAAFGQFLLLTNDGGEDRAQAVRYAMSNFLPNNTIEIAYRSDKTLQDR
jgi:spectinomycin phosphotransferase